MIEALGAKDVTTTKVRGLYLGAAITEGEPTGNELAAAEIVEWLGKRFSL